MRWIASCQDTLEKFQLSNVEILELSLFKVSRVILVGFPCSGLSGGLGAVCISQPSADRP